MSSDGGGGVGSSSAVVPPLSRGRGAGRSPLGRRRGTPILRTPGLPPVSELPDFGSAVIRQMVGSSWVPESRGSRSGSTLPSHVDWENFLSFTPVVQTPVGTVVGSPSVGTVPWSLSPPTSAAVRGVELRDVDAYEAGLRASIGGAGVATVEVVGVGDRGKAPVTEPDRVVEPEEVILPPQPPVRVGTSGAGPSGASSSFALPEIPRDIMYYDQGRVMHYRVPDLQVVPEQLGSLSDIPPDEVRLFRVGDVADLVRSYYNAWGLLTFVAPVPPEYMERYRRRLAGEPSVTHRSSRSRSVAPSQSVHGVAQPSARTSRPPTPHSRSRVASVASEGVGETEAKRPRTTDQPPPPPPS